MRIRKSLVTPSERKALRSAMSGMRRLVAARLGEADLARLRAHVRTGNRELSDVELRDLVAGHILLRRPILDIVGEGLACNPRWHALEVAAAKALDLAPAGAGESNR